MNGEMMLFPDTVDEFMEQYKLVDEDHVYSNGTAFVPIFRMKQWFDHLQSLPITNADRIRRMSDEELANCITDDLCDRVCHSPLSCGGNCEIQVLDWLKQEAGND